MPRERKKVEYIISDDGCFICTSHHRDKDGYARINIIRNDKKVKTSVHKFIYEQMFGEIEKGIVIMHSCDNPNCINPEHLKSGTHAENTRDMMEKKRKSSRKGESRNKLNDEDIGEIRSGKYTIMEMVEKYNVCIATIKRAKNGHSYKNIAN